jgi:hypothetical protein
VNQRNLSERRNALYHGINLRQIDVLGKADASRLYVVEDVPRLEEEQHQLVEREFGEMLAQYRRVCEHLSCRITPSPPHDLPGREVKNAAGRSVKVLVERS